MIDLKKNSNQLWLLLAIVLALYLRETFAPTPTYARLFSRLGQNFEEKGLDLKALSAYKRAVYHNPAYQPANFYLAVLYEKFNQPASALKFFQKTFALGPQKPNDQKYGMAAYKVGMTYFRQEEFVQAIEIFEKAVKHWVGDGEIYYYLAMGYDALGNIDKCVEIVQDLWRHQMYTYSVKIKKELFKRHPELDVKDSPLRPFN